MNSTESSNTPFENDFAESLVAGAAKLEKDEDARELLLNLMADTIERIRATPGNSSLDREQAIYLLSEIEEWCVGQHEDGYLRFRDPADEVTREAI